MNTKMYCSIEQAKRLKELGVVQDNSPFYWVKINDTGSPKNDYWLLPIAEHTKFVRLDRQGVTFPDNASFWINDKKEIVAAWDLEKYAAFSVGELLAMLPQEWHLWRVEDDDTYSGIEWRCSDDYCSLLYYKGNDLAASALFYTIIEESKHNPAFSIEAINARYLEAIKE